MMSLIKTTSSNNLNTDSARVGTARDGQQEKDGKRTDRADKSILKSTRGELATKAERVVSDDLKQTASH